MENPSGGEAVLETAKAELERLARELPSAPDGPGKERIRNRIAGLAALAAWGVLLLGGGWLPAVKNREDFAGIFNRPIDGLMMKTDTGKTLRYAVHLRRKNKWLPFVTGYSETDAANGYAGILGQEIDAVRIAFA